MKMNAFEIPGLRFSLVSEAAIERHRFVTVLNSGRATMADPTEVAATNAIGIIGVSMNKCDRNDQVAEIADGIVMVEAACAINPGDPVGCVGQGKVSNASGVTKFAVALTGCSAAGNLVTVQMGVSVVPGTKTGT